MICGLEENYVCVIAYNRLFAGALVADEICLWKLEHLGTAMGSMLVAWCGLPSLLVLNIGYVILYTLRVQYCKKAMHEMVSVYFVVYVQSKGKEEQEANPLASPTPSPPHLLL